MEMHAERGGLFPETAHSSLSNAPPPAADRFRVEPRGLRVLVFQRLRGTWVARGLEHDLAVEGRSLASVIDRIHQLVLAHVAFDRRHGRAPLSTFPAAPRRFWDAFERATRLPTRKSGASQFESSFGPIAVAMIVEPHVDSMIASAFDPSVVSGGGAVRNSRPHRPVH